VSGKGPEPVRTNTLNEVSDILGLGPKPQGELTRVMELRAAEGRGVAGLFRQPRKELFDTEEDGPRIVKNTGLGAQMLAELGLTQLVLLTDSPMTTYLGLDAYDLEIVGTRPIMGGA